jgi:hypothetical protein
MKRRVEIEYLGKVRESKNKNYGILEGKGRYAKET